MLPTSLSMHCNKIESYVLSPPASEDGSAALTRRVQLALIDWTRLYTWRHKVCDYHGLTLCYRNCKQTGTYVVLFYSIEHLKVVFTTGLFHPVTHTFRQELLSNISLSHTHTRTLMDSEGETQILLKDISMCRLKKPWIRPLTFQLADDLSDRNPLIIISIYLSI